MAAELAAFGWRGLDVPRPSGLPSGETAGLGWQRGAVYGRADLATLYRTLLAGRTPVRIVALLGTAEVDTLDEIRAAVAAIDLSLLPHAPFAVRPERHGDHPFRSPDIGREAGAGVIDEVRARTGQRLPVDLDDPVSEIRVELWDSRLRVGVDLTDGSLHRREWLARHHHAGLKPTTAAALLAMAGWRADERLLDPMCGGATIPIEAGLAALRRPLRRALPRSLAAFGLRDPALADEAEAASAEAAVPDAPLQIAGLERYPKHLDGAAANRAAADLARAIDLIRGDATKMEGISEVDCVVTNPPFGMRVGSTRILEPLYTKTLARTAERLRPGGRALVLSPAARLVRRAAHHAGLTVARARSVSLGSIDAVAFVLTASGDPGPSRP